MLSSLDYLFVATYISILFE